MLHARTGGTKMQVVEIIKLVVDYGISVIISAIVVYALFRAIKIKFDAVEHKIARKSHDKALALRTEIDEQVHGTIDNFLQKHDGTRIQVIEFTNTVTSVAYLPFRYMSCTYEVVEYGHRPKASYIDKLSTSLFSPFLAQLGKESYIELNSDNIDDMSGTIQDLYHQIGCKHMLSVMLKSNKVKCIGCVSFYKETDVSKQDVDDIISLGNKLSTLLGVLDK